MIKIFVSSAVVCCAQAFEFPELQRAFVSIVDGFPAAGVARFALSMSAAEAFSVYKTEVATKNEDSTKIVSHREERIERIDRESGNIVGIYSSSVSHLLTIVQILIFASQKN